MSVRNPEILVIPEQEYIARYMHSAADLQDLVQRNSASVILAQSTYRFIHGYPHTTNPRTNQFMKPERFDPYQEDKDAREDHRPFSSLNKGPKDFNPKILLVSRLEQGDPYFIARPYYPYWCLTPDFFDRAMQQQSRDEGNRLGRFSFGKVIQLNGAAVNAEICGILFTRFFEKSCYDFEGDATNINHPSDWEIVSRFLDPEAEKTDYQGPEVFTFRSTFENVYGSKKWEKIARERDISHPISGGLPTEEKGKLVEELVGNALESLLGEVDNRHVRQVAGRLLRLHPYDQTHQLQFADRVLYQLNQDPYYFLANQFLLAGEQADKIIPNPDAPVYIPNYGRIDTSIMGNMLIPDVWIKNTYHKNQINALGELVFAASLARDDSNGRLRGFSSAPYFPGMTHGNTLMFNSFDTAVERALIHTALLIQEVYERDAKGHGIYPRLSGISKKAIDKYGRFGENLARHHYLYDDQDGRHVNRNDRPGPGRGPDDDFIGSSPRGGQPHLGSYA